MHIRNQIISLKLQISVIGDKFQSVKPFSDSTIRAITASEERACLEYPKPAAAARLSVASNALNFIAIYVSNMVDASEIKDEVSDIVATSINLAPITKPKHFTNHPHGAPSGWSGSVKGPYRKVIDEKVFSLVFNPGLPGGGWSLCLSGISVAFGETPDTVASMADNLVSIMRSASNKHDVKTHCEGASGPLGP